MAAHRQFSIRVRHIQWAKVRIRPARKGLVIQRDYNRNFPTLSQLETLSTRGIAHRALVNAPLIKTKGSGKYFHADRPSRKCLSKRWIQNEGYIWAPHKVVEIIPKLPAGKAREGGMILNSRGSAHGIS